jgi:uncharacterized integral membrane protein (TIGR00698 family)
LIDAAAASAPGRMTFVAPLREAAWWRGLALAAGLAALGMAAAQTSWAQRLGLSALTLAIALGILAGNTFFPRIAPRSAAGVDFAKSRLLRLGIVLYGTRITFQQIGAIGWAGALIDVVTIGLTFVLAVQLGTRVFKLDRQTAILIGAGSAICGAAAVMATEPVVRGQAHKVSVAVATVVVFGTLSMFLYPLLYPHLGLSEQAYGVYAGSTIHEVAQVVAAGRSVSDAAAATAVIEKMLRVMMLAPFLLLLTGAERGHATAHHGTARPGRAPITIPWFAFAFVAVSAVNSLHIVPPGWSDALVEIDTALLATAMGALGLRTHIGAVRQAGTRPLLLAAVLCGFLIVGGYGLNRLVTQLLG